MATVRASGVFSPKPLNSTANSAHFIVLNSSERIETPYSDRNDETIRSKSSIRS